MDQTSGEENAVLSIPVSKRSDTGKYTINLKNKFGEDSGDLNIIVLGQLTEHHCSILSYVYSKQLIQGLKHRSSLESCRSLGYNVVSTTGYIFTSCVGSFTFF